ncbi:ABC transporter permease, partial [Streptomyces griseoincarnatus]
MLTFLRRRAVTSLLPLVAVLLGVFLLARMTGDPAVLYLPENATEAQKETFLDLPIWQQLLDYLGGVLRLDFGTSLRTGEPAAEMALRAFPATLQLALTTMVLAVVISIVIGSYAAYRPNSLADRLASFMSMTAASVPDFWLAITGVWIFA